MCTVYRCYLLELFFSTTIESKYLANAGMDTNQWWPLTGVVLWLRTVPPSRVFRLFSAAATLVCGWTPSWTAAPPTSAPHSATSRSPGGKTSTSTAWRSGPSTKHPAPTPAASASDPTPWKHRHPSPEAAAHHFPEANVAFTPPKTKQNNNKKRTQSVFCERKVAATVAGNGSRPATR